MPGLAEVLRGPDVQRDLRDGWAYAGASRDAGAVAALVADSSYLYRRVEFSTGGARAVVVLRRCCYFGEAQAHEIERLTDIPGLAAVLRGPDLNGALDEGWTWAGIGYAPSAPAASPGPFEYRRVAVAGGYIALRRRLGAPWRPPFY